MEHLVQILRRHALHRFVLRDEALRHHLHGDAHRGKAGPLSTTRLQHVQLAVLEGELDVLHVPEMALELGGDAFQLAIHLGQRATLHLGDRLRGSGPGHDVFPLRIGEKIPVERGFAGAAVAREGHSSARVVAHVAVHHRHHVHRGAQVVRNPVDPPVVRGAAGPPALEDRLDRAPELRHRILGKGQPRPGLNDGLELSHQGAQVVRGEVDIPLDASATPYVVEHLLERLLAQIEHHVAVHLHEAAVGVIGESRVRRAGHEPLNRVIVEPEVQDRLHHAGHRNGRAGAHGDEQRVSVVAEPLLGRPLELL